MCHYCGKKGHMALVCKKCKYDQANGINKPQANDVVIAQDNSSPPLPPQYNYLLLGRNHNKIEMTYGI